MRPHKPQDPQLETNELYQKRRKAAIEDRPPSTRGAIGIVAKIRSPGSKTRSEMRDAIFSQDQDLEVGYFGAVRYKPALICGKKLKLEPAQPSIGTIIHGLDLAVDLDDPEMVQFLRQLWLHRRVIMFRDQGHLTRMQLREFALKFGEVGAPFGEREHVPNSPHDLNQQIKDREIPEMLLLPSDEDVPNAASGWHCDATWQSKPPMGSILMCREAPIIGGDTCFCDCYAMWEGLSSKTQRRVEQLTAVHIGTAGHQMDGITPIAVHPVARTHPETGLTTLYVQQGFVHKFADEHNVPKEEQKALLSEMKLQEGRPEYTCRFRWEPGSIAMWDNRAVLHTASGDFWPHRRFMERLTILDYDESRRKPFYAPAMEVSEQN